MTSIIKATKKDYNLLADIGKQTFLESHGESAEKKDIDTYVNQKNSTGFFQNDLADSKNIYHILYYKGTPAGYSKIILNNPHENIGAQNVTKLERLYLLKDFYELKLGLELFKFNVELSKRNNQAGMWLFTWKENTRAINFYLKNGFKIIGSYDFKLSDTHSNPNHHMFLEY
ncbi:MAG: GNAT family N-acetyltransferase [Ginsengibacter sp.]